MKRNYMVVKFFLFFSFLFLLKNNSFAQLSVDDAQTAQQLVDRLTGDGVITLNPVLNCPSVANGTFVVTGTSNLGIDSGIVLTSGRAKTQGINLGVNGPTNTTGGPSNFNNAPGDPQLTALAGQTTKDACILEFDFVPAGDTVKFNYVFGSAEYKNYSCSSFNDAFAFFISGPNIPGGTQNIAVVPGTNVPITVNSTTGMGSGTLCTNIAPGSPFSQYFINNTGGQTISYIGFTQVFTAISAVTPCDTYHLKLAIADAFDDALDSGTFLEAGSLTSAAITVKTFGGAGLEVPYTNTVRGCPPGKVEIKRTGSVATPVTIPLSYEGTGVNGVDYATLPSSITIPVGDSIATLYVTGIPMASPVGMKTVIVNALSPYTCGNGDPIILGSDTIRIYDSIYVNILNPDTTICIGESVEILAEADSTLNFSWTPTTGVNDPSEKNIIVTPTTTTTYKLTVSLNVIANCPPASDLITVVVRDTPQVNLGPDVAVCSTAVQLNAETYPPNPEETFVWTPTTGLSNPNIRNPLATPTQTTDYIVTVHAGPVGCDGKDTIRIRVLPDHITVLNNDTIVCDGTVLDLLVDGDTAFSYTWAPEVDIAQPTEANTSITARQSGYYAVTASFPGCNPMSDSVYIEVQPNPIVNIGNDRIICSYDTIHFLAAIMPSDYPNYIIHWSPGDKFNDSTAVSPVFKSEMHPGMMVKVDVSTPIGCKGSDSVNVIVNPGDFLNVSPDTLVCPPTRVQLFATGAQQYRWTPYYGLNDTAIANPISTAISTTEYTVYGVSTAGCLDTQYVLIEVAPDAIIALEESATIWPGESYHIQPEGNGLYYSWFPSSGLSADNIPDPMASPEVRTRYFVTATTENGCQVIDSIDILVNTESVLELPNAFTPGNGINNIFKPVKRGAATLKYFRVYNRWGNVVFETTDINQGWDGTYKGTPQPLGVYIYDVEAETPSGQVFNKKGNVTLLR